MSVIRLKPKPGKRNEIPDASPIEQSSMHQGQGPRAFDSCSLKSRRDSAQPPGSPLRSIILSERPGAAGTIIQQH